MVIHMELLLVNVQEVKSIPVNFRRFQQYLIGTDLITSEKFKSTF